MRSLFLSILIMFVFNTAFGQVHSVGRILSYKKIDGGIEGKTQGALFDIHAYSDNTIRVRITKNKTLNSFSYALVTNEIPSLNVTVTDKGNLIELSTSAITVVVEKEPTLRLIFKNKQGAVINEDVPGDGFGTTFIGDKVSSYKKLQEGERFVGMGEVLGNLDKRGMAFTLNNTDTYKYGDPRLSMYISIPFYIGIHHQQVYGLFYNNSFKTLFNFGLSTPFTSVTAEGGNADYFFFYDNSPSKVIEHYTSLTGRINLPPIWSIGYHQSRCSYYPQQKVESIAETLRNKKIPVDCIVLDADYQQDYQPFRTNLQRFPDLPALAAKLSAMNIELTASVYPGVAIDTTYHSYTDGLKKDVFIKYADGSLFKTEIAPVKCVLPDYTNPNTRRWWKEKMKWMKENGINGYWNDMNEPAIGGSYLPDNLEFDFDGRKASSLEAKNVYGFQMARSSYEAALQNSPAKRPFILSRSGFAGVQRYSAVWSGDNTVSDEGLLSSVLLNNQMGLSGISFCGHDIGGFIGDASPDLFKRWIEVGVFSPFCRNHKGCDMPDGEPWAYGEEAETISRAYLGFRYRLMPYIYSSFYAASKTGMPVARSLCLNDPFDEKVYDNNFQYQFLFGDALMVTPVTSVEKNKTVYLPKGVWYDLFTDEKIEGGKTITQSTPICKIPLMVKESSIIPMQSLVQSNKEKASDTLFVHVYNGSEKNIFTWYEDAGDGFEYRQSGYNKRMIELDPLAKQIIFHEQEGAFKSVFKKIQIIFHGFDSIKNEITVAERNVTGGPENKSVQLKGKLQKLETVSTAVFQLPGELCTMKAAKNYPALTVDNTRGEIKIIW